MANNQIALLSQAPVLDTPFESQGKALQLRQLMNQGAVQDMDMAQRRQAIADDAGARNVFATESDPAARIQALYKINPKAAQAFEKAQADISKDRASTGETEAKTRNENLKAINIRMQQARDLLGNVNDKQTAATWVQGLYADPDIGKFLTQHVGPVEQALARIPDPQADPQGFANWRRASQLSAEKLVETTMPKVGTRDLGGQVQTTLTDPITGMVKVTDTNAKTQTPDSIASNATQRRGQDMSDLRAREAADGKEASFTSGAIDNAAARYNIDGTLPPMGMGNAGSQARSAILNRAAELAGANGLSPDEQRIAQIGNKGNSAAISKLQQQKTMVGAFERNFNSNADIVKEFSNKVDRTGVPILNKWINAGKRAVAGDPDLVAFDVALKAVSNEYAKIISGSMGNTATAQGEIAKVASLLEAAHTPEQVTSVVNLMQRETQNRMKGFDDEMGSLRESMKPKKAGAKPSLSEIFK